MMEAIYLDIDGTLRDELEGIPESAIWALKQCHKRNIKIILCTGRNLAFIQNDVWKLPADGIISGGGCQIRYGDKLLWKKFFLKEDIEEIIRTVFLHQRPIALETEQSIFMNHLAASFYCMDIDQKTERLDERRRKQFLLQNKIRYEDNFHQFLNQDENVHKICVFGNRKEIDQIKFLIQEKAELIQEKIWNGQWYLELLPEGCNKGEAIRRLNKELKIRKENTICFGDSENDIEMMKETGVAVAVGNGSYVLHQYASSICEPVLENGIYKELTRRNIIKPMRRRNKENEKKVVAEGSRISDLSEKFL